MANSQSFDTEYDLIVVGSGASGKSAALTAARAGLKVVILEKMPESPDIPGMACFILYLGKPVGRIRHTVNSEGQKITGDICIEIIEEAKSEKRRFQQKVV